MRYTIAAVVSVLATAGMFAFRGLMDRQLEKWAERNAVLVPFQVLMLDVAEWWTRYWYVGIVAIVVVCFAAAAAMPRRQSAE